MRQLTIWAVFFLMTLTACEKEETFSLATSNKGLTYNKVGECIVDLFEQEKENNRFSILAGTEYGSQINSKLLWDGEVDFAISSNDAKTSTFLNEGADLSDSKICTVMPLYPEILFIVYPAHIKASSLKELLTARRVAMGPENSATAAFFKKIISHLHISEGSFTRVFIPFSDYVTSDKMDISVILAGANSTIIGEMLENKKHKLFSLDKQELLGNGSMIDGFCTLNPTVRPYLIPKQLYGEEPIQPIATLAIDAVLLCRSDIDKYRIHKIVTEIYTQKSTLAQKDISLNAIDEDQDMSSLFFPLHEGTTMYLDRNKPSFIERYGKSIGVIISSIVTSIIAFLKWKQTQRRGMIDQYYQIALDIERKFFAMDSAEEVNEAIDELFDKKKEAIDLLIKEKLVADDSFNIYLKLNDDLIERLEYKYTALTENV